MGKLTNEEIEKIQKIIIEKIMDLEKDFSNQKEYEVMKEKVTELNTILNKLGALK